jgi:hypothetical protein
VWADEPPPDESAPEASWVREWYACCYELDFESHLRFSETGHGRALEHNPWHLTPYEWQAASAEVINRWVHQAPVSMRRGPRVREIREDQARKARERRARIFAEHEWVEVPNAHPLSEPGQATEPVEPGFDVTKTNEPFPEARRIRRV